MQGYCTLLIYDEFNVILLERMHKKPPKTCKGGPQGFQLLRGLQ